MFDTITFQRKEMALQALLEITKAINANLTEVALYRIYHFTLRGNLNVPKMVLFVSEDNIWTCKVAFGTKNKPENTIFEEELLAEFEHSLPILHNQKEIAHVFISTSEEIDISFVETLTNILIVAIENRKLARQQLLQEGMKKEMEIARHVQTLLFPKKLPKTDKLYIDAYYQPHSSVGGDYYDYIKLNDTRFLICIADVSGKGMAAALMMANFQASLRTLTRQTDDLKKIVEELNFSVYDNARGENFITFFMAIYDNTEKQLSYINAGHNPPYLINKNIHNNQQKENNLDFERLEIGCTVLGFFTPLPFLEIGVCSGLEQFFLFSFTDGLPETFNNKEELFDEIGIEAFIRNNKNLNPIEFHQKIIKEVNEFRGKIPFSDDITLFSCVVNN